MTATVTAMLNMARSQIGTVESPRGSNRIKYNDWYVSKGFGGQDYLTAAWCAIFQSWCASQVGATDIIPVHAYTPSGLAWFQARGLVTRGSGAKPGDLVYVHYSGSGEIVGHVGIVEAVLSSTQIQTIEGNSNTDGSATGYGVFRVRRTVSDRLYFCHPRYAAAAPTVSTGGTEMKLTDVIGKDGKGKAVTVGQALGRAVWAYDAQFAGGFMGKRMADVEASVRALKARAGL